MVGVTSYITGPANIRYNQASMRKPILILLSENLSRSPFDEHFRSCFSRSVQERGRWL
jgi:hypothetical protein